MSSPEQETNKDQSENVEIQQVSTEQLEKLAQSQEKTAELSPRDLEARAEKARVEALKNAASAESVDKKISTRSSSKPKNGIINKKELDKSFKQTMKVTQEELPTIERIFSKVIHNKVIEKTSEAVGNTIARPNAILAGAFFAFILTLLTYTIAKTIGYKLSGSETIIAFIIGWTIGIVYDYLKILFIGKKT